MKRAKSMQTWAVALGIVLAGVVFAGCPGSQKNYPTQPAARNVIPGIETGAVEAAFDCLQEPQTLKVLFLDQSTGPIQTWTWQFGDGRTSSQQNPEHKYKEPGTYIVSLTVSTGNTSDTASQFVSIDEFATGCGGGSQ